MPGNLPLEPDTFVGRSAELRPGGGAVDMPKPAASPTLMGGETAG
ncbi:hypothetical protein [Streptomyces sp. SA15]|nr:hypothetical protein [Streptomyces sp. SA15]